MSMSKNAAVQTPFQKFEALARKLAAVPKSEVDKLAVAAKSQQKGLKTAGSKVG